MPLTHKITRKFELPNEPGEWVEVRLPSLAILDRAREARSRKAIQMMAGIDFSQLKSFTPEGQTATWDATYDWQTLLIDCILAWSYPDPLTRENIGELDEVTVKLLVNVLVPADTEAKQKKG